MHDLDNNAIAAAPASDDAEDMQKTKTQFIKANWKKAAFGLIALDLSVAAVIAIFGGSSQIQSMVFGIFR